MQSKAKVVVALILPFLSGTVLADRPLEREEVLEIFKTLTLRPKKTWFVSGVICARHEEYRAPKTTDSNEIVDRINQEVQTYLENPGKSELTQKLQQMMLEAIPFNVRYRLSNEYTMVSNVNVRFDGDRFYWEIIVGSRTDSVTSGAEMAGNFYTEEFNLGWNRERVFAWDGEKYTTYFRPGNHAIITGIPSGINGPLTAGVIPWGHGRYSYKHLTGVKSSAVDVGTGGESEIHLTITNNDREETFVLDPAKDYAVKLYSTISGNSSMTVRNYSGYQLVSGKWCPGNIIIEQYDTTTNPPRLMARDIWDFTSIGNSTTRPDSFDVYFGYDAFIEDFRFGSKPLQYRYSPPEEPSVRNVNVDELLQNRLEIAHSPELQGQNCATISLRYVCGKLGVSAPWKELSQLVHGSQKRTTLFEMKGFIDGLGLHSHAVKTDLEKLRVSGDYQAVLHLPRDNHYVVLGDVSDNYVRLIDLDKNDFYYRTSIGHFESVWDNTALVVGNKPVAMEGNFAKIDDSQLREITGAENCQTCTDKIQNSGDSPCPDNGVPGSCGGSHKIYYERYCCESASSGSCYESGMVGSKSQSCIEDENLDCSGDGEWTVSSIEACN